jgi:hypothetical protein
MKGIIQTMLEEIYAIAHEISVKNNQRVGDKHDFYITLDQLNNILKYFED